MTDQNENEITFQLDGHKVTGCPGETVIEVADRHGVHIPRFCYHHKLSVAANCRMCLVQVGDGPKAMPACATPIADGMEVKTASKQAVDAQRAVMEFLLINHPLDCPICDQGGECALQDLSMGYGYDRSHYDETKRCVADEDLGPLIATEMTRCIHCTRCVRVGVEIAGIPELGTLGRGEDARIGTYLQTGVRSELSGNMIDVCPVGALTSKPFRFRGRSWEFKQHLTLSAHDCVGSNLHMHTIDQVEDPTEQIMRVVPAENPDINDCWLSDRDRFSYAGLFKDRLKSPMIKNGKSWDQVSWEVALSHAADKLRSVIKRDGGEQLAALSSPNATLEECYLLQGLMRGLGSNHLDHRVHEADFSDQDYLAAYPSIPLSLPEIEQQKLIVLVGANPRLDQPLLGYRIRRAQLAGATVVSVGAVDYPKNYEGEQVLVSVRDQVAYLAGVILSVTKQLKVPLPAEVKPWFEGVEAARVSEVLVQALLTTKGAGLWLMGNEAMAHPQAGLMRQFIALLTDLCAGKLGLISQGANGAGAWLAGMVPHRGPMGSVQDQPGDAVAAMWHKPKRAYWLHQLEPEHDCLHAGVALRALKQAECVICCTPFDSKAMRDYADVILPCVPLTESGGTLVNTTGLWQTVSPVVMPYATARPAWKILRVMADYLGVEGFKYNTLSEITEVLQSLHNAMTMPTFKRMPVFPLHAVYDFGTYTRLGGWPIYRADALVRRSSALQAMQAAKQYIGLAPATMKQLALKSGDKVRISQGDQQVVLPVVEDQNLVDDAVWLPAGLEESKGFGAMMCAITVERV